jgi:N-formylglutamate amidohydrolase
MWAPYNLALPTSEPIPILLSIPHGGTVFPKELADQYKKKFIQSPDDTDWFVDQLYGFAAAMGITTISAVYSRWVIDLNRHPESKPLYTDGRIITGLCPTTDFLGNHLYTDNRSELNLSDIQKRLIAYYWPYHEALQNELNGLREKFGKVLLWDCHSIRQSVLTIQQEKFPDLILGDADSTSASPGVIETTIKVLENSGYSFSHNHPFKGGYITRQYGKPSENIHALQLEMTKVNYMDDAEIQYDAARASRMQQLLQSVLVKLEDSFFH